MSEALCLQTIREAGRRLRAREFTAVELTRAFLDRIERLNPTLNAYITVTADRALEDARQADAELAAGRDRGPLHGIPVALKDVIETRGIRTTAHSWRLFDNVPERDATVARMLADAGSVLLGKLATFEFAIGGPSDDLPFPLARNPWGVDRYTGGSSSGSGVAVGAALTMAAIGTDAGGSVRLPAAHCGVVGFKPSYGLVSRSGIFPLTLSLDHVGPLTWTVEDAAVVLGAIAGHDPADPESTPGGARDFAAPLAAEGGLEGLRIGAIRHFYERDFASTPELRQAMDDALGRLAALGAAVDEIELSPLDDYQASCLTILIAEAYSLFERDLIERRGDFGSIFRHRITMGAFLGAADYLAAQRLRKELTAETDAALRRCDALVTASMFSAPVRVADFPKHAMFVGRYITGPSNLTGHPALALRCGFSAEGLPLSMQMIGRRGEDAALLRLAHRFERSTPWPSRRPPL